MVVISADHIPTLFTLGKMQRGNEQEEEKSKGGASNGDADPESLIVTVLVHTIRVADPQHQSEPWAR